MKKITLLFILFSLIVKAQLTQKDIGKFEIEEGTYQLEVLTQKLEGNQYITTKNKRYVVTIFEFAIESQKIYDSIDGNMKLNYLYDENSVLKRMKYSDFDDNLKKEVEYLYDQEGNLLFEKTFDESGDEVVEIAHYYDNCKSEYISDLLDDSNAENNNGAFNCETITTIKKISNYTTSIVNVYKTEFGKIKKISLKENKDTPIIRFYLYTRDENSNVLSVDMIKGNRIKRYKTSKYNEKEDLIHMKSGFVEFFYAYKYDENGNWTEKIETSKVKGKRTVYKQRFIY